MVTTGKLRVEILDARNLMPKDGFGSSSPYVVVRFGSQEYKTQTKVRDLNPVWNETLSFEIEPPLPNNNTVKFFRLNNRPRNDVISLKVKHDKSHGPTRRSGDLGEVCLDLKHFVERGEEVLRYYPLKRSIFKNMKGHIGLKLSYKIEDESATADDVPLEQDTMSVTEVENSIHLEPKPEPEPEPEPELDDDEMMVLHKRHIDEGRRTNQGNEKSTSLQAFIFCCALLLWRHLLDFGAVLFPYHFQLLKRLGLVIFSYVFPLLKSLGIGESC
ncbi:Protein QUIRKY [Arachis hypogaea]|nr:Protein QUIRKY [Arachis hypogaea]